MLKLYLASCCWLVLLFPAFSQDHLSATSDSLVQLGLKRYEVEKGMVEYKISGANTGQEILWFDRWGWREAKYAKKNIDVYGMPSEEYSVSMMDGDLMINADLNTKQGTRMYSTIHTALLLESGKTSLTEAGEDLILKMGGKNLGTEMILGKPCDIWEIESLKTKTWVWQGITLKTEINLMGMDMTVEAVKVDTARAIPETEFQLPHDVEIQDLEETPLNSR